MYLRGVIESVNPDFTRSDRKHECRRTFNFFPPGLRLALGRWPFNCNGLAKTFSALVAELQVGKDLLLVYQKIERLGEALFLGCLSVGRLQGQQ